MQVYVNQVTGIADAITTMFMSKRTWTRDLERNIRETVEVVTDENGIFLPQEEHYNIPEGYYKDYNDWMNKLTKWTKTHITLGRFIDFSVTVEGLHRAGQDDWDAHAHRFENRIIRSSTRMAKFTYEMSNYYQDKIISTDEALAMEHIETPNEIVVDGVKYVKVVNGYVREDLRYNNDVLRGLYMLSIPSNFIFKINLTQWAHVYKERNKNGHANPEVKECCEAIADQLQKFQPWFTRELFEEIRN